MNATTATATNATSPATTPVLGHVVGGSKKLHVTLAKLLISRLVILADSGAGKSYLIRKLCEILFGFVQIIIIDREGEYESLRERFPFIIVGGENGDIPVATSTAALLARRLMETSASAIININDLRPVPMRGSVEDRQNFVGVFTTALLELPKNLRKPLLFIVDEMQDFAPEGGKEPPSLIPLVNMNFQGRKRSICLVVAGQASALISKNVIRGIGNKLVGRTALPKDNKETAKELRLDADGAEELRGLADGVFFGFGPALSATIVKFKVDAAKTTHPEPGGPQLVVPAPPAAIKALLAELSDLPKQAATEAKTEADRKGEVAKLRGEITSLTASLRTLEIRLNNKEKELEMAKVKRTVEIEVEEKNVVEKGQIKALENAIKALQKTLAVREKQLALSSKILDREAQAQQAIVTTMGNLAEQIALVTGESPRPAHVAAKSTMPSPRSSVVPIERGTAGGGAVAVPISGNRRDRVLSELAFYHPEGLTQAQLATLSDYAVDSRPFLDILRALRAEGTIYYEPGKPILLMGVDKAGEMGLDQIRKTHGATARHAHLKHWIRSRKLGNRCREVLQRVFSAGSSVDASYLAAETNYAEESRPFLDILRFLREVGLVDYDSSKKTVAPSAFLLRSGS